MATSAERSRVRSSPPASSERIRRRMASTKQRDTTPELALRSQLHRRGLRFFVDRAVVGKRRRVDIVFPTERIAVFVDGCFWHSCPVHGTTPRRNRDWWRAKLESNRFRDIDTNRELQEAGWTVLRFYEHEDMAEAATVVSDCVLARRKSRATRPAHGVIDCSDV
jgi:DNA mismatch endonuclease (patch repair protein)